MVKLYHWKTRSYAQHQATDELYLKLNKHIDSFVEVLLGKDERRIKMLEKRIDLGVALIKKNLKNNRYRIKKIR